MSGLNKVMIIGRLGKDPEIRYTQAGTAICNFSVATSEQWIDKATGQKQEKTEWHNCVSFGKQAETLEKYLKKGLMVYIEGKLTTDQYDKDGQTHYSTKIKIDGFQFLGGKSDDTRQEQQHRTEYKESTSPDQPHGKPYMMPDDDIPF